MPNKLDRFFFIIFILATFSLGFFAGGICVYYKSSPYELIHESAMAYKAVRDKRRAIERALHALPVKKVGSGVPDINEKGSFGGYTLYVADQSKAVLIDQNGKEVYQWHSDFSRVWPDHPHITNPIPDSWVRWHDVVLFPNGDLLAIFEAASDTPYGYGLAKFDKHSQLIWRYDACVHHQIFVDRSGQIYTLLQQVIRPSVPGIHFANEKIIADSFVTLSPEGKVIDTIPLIDAMANSNYSHLLVGRARRYVPKGDILHANSAVPLTPDLASAFPMFKPGQILISMREISAIGVLDVPSRKFIWMATGDWKSQHDARFSEDGTIMMFDNQGAGLGKSRILKFNPTTKETHTVFEGNQGHPFFTKVLGMEQQLPNGNLLLLEAGSSRILETTPGGKIVWQFIGPYYRGSERLEITTARRYASQDLSFLSP